MGNLIGLFVAEDDYNAEPARPEDSMWSSLIKVEHQIERHQQLPEADNFNNCPVFVVIQTEKAGFNLL